MQRSLLLCVTKCYATTSTDALHVLSGVLPLDLRAGLERDYTALVRWKKSVDGTGLDSESVDLWRPTPRLEDLWRVRWTADLEPRTACSYYTDGSKQENATVGCAFLAVSENQVTVESQFRLSDGAEVFAAEVQAIKEAITHAHGRGLGELDIYSDSRSALQALHGLVPQHKAIAEIRDLIKTTGIEVHLHWIRAHVGHIYNERADILAKEATTRQSVDVVIPVTRRQAKKDLFGRALSMWQERWDQSETGRKTYESFPRVGIRRLQGDFFVNQVFTGHGTFGDHQARFFNHDSTCFCGVEVCDISHVLFRCELWKPVREKYFPRDFQTRTPSDLCLCGYARKGVRLIIQRLLMRTLDRNLGRQRAGRNHRALPRPRLNALRNARGPRGAGRRGNGRGNGAICSQA